MDIISRLRQMPIEFVIFVGSIVCAFLLVCAVAALLERKPRKHH